MDVEVLETLIPFFGMLTMCSVIIVWFYLKYKTRLHRQETLRLALEKGNELSPEFMKELSEPEPSKDRDLRRSLIWFSLAFGLALIGIAVPDPEALRGTLAGAALPFSIGCAFLIMYVYGKKKES